MSGRFVAENGVKAPGAAKLVYDADSLQVLGLIVNGSYASEMIWGASVVLETELSVNDLRQIVWDAFGKPKRTLLHGQSWGGNVAAKAAELLFTGDVIDAEEALRIGLVREVAPHEELMDRAQALAGRIAANPPLALRYMKEGLRRATYGDPRDLGGWAIETIRRLMQTEDHREGVASFLEKRAPVFQGR